MSQVYHAEPDRKKNYEEETETHQTGNITHIKAHMFFFKSVAKLKLNLWQRGNAAL